MSSNRVHQIKCWPEFFRAVKSGEKPFEIRNNDRGYAVGDYLHIEEWCPIEGKYTGDACFRKITYMTDWVQQPGTVVLGIYPVTSES